MGILTDGHPTTITISGVTVTLLKETSVTPPGISGGGANDTTNMRNNVWRTNQPKKLKTLTNATIVGQYSPDLYPVLVNSINVNQLLRVDFPDGAYLEFWGWLDEFTPQQSTEGAPPTANLVVIPSNQDNNGVETAPVLTPAL